MAGIVFFAKQAEADPVRPELNQLRQEGCLVTVEVIPIQKTIRLLIVGREEVKLSMTDLKLTVRSLSPVQSEFVTFKQDGNFYTPSEPFNIENVKDIEVKAESGFKSETLQFNLSNIPR